MDGLREARLDVKQPGRLHERHGWNGDCIGPATRHARDLSGTAALRAVVP